MKPTCHSRCLDFLTVTIRFLFPWVRLLEMKAVSDTTWDINNVAEEEEKLE